MSRVQPLSRTALGPRLRSPEQADRCDRMAAAEAREARPKLHAVISPECNLFHHISHTIIN